MLKTGLGRLDGMGFGAIRQHRMEDTMNKGNDGMGMRKHGRSGWKNGSGKSPRLRFHMKMEAEKNERKDRSKIRNPKKSVAELLDSNGRGDNE